MWLRKYFILILISFFICNFAYAQQPPVVKDSTLLYKNIETFSGRNKFTRFMYSLIFKPVIIISKTKSPQKKAYKKLIQKPYSVFEGKAIRNINIITLDPFGYFVDDTTVATQNFLYKAGNGLHIKTKNIAIRNLLLFHEGSPFISLRAKESERLIRSQKYVHEVSFYVAQAGKEHDSVDVFIRVLDKWSIILVGSMSSNSMRAGITDNNFAGLGHEFQIAYDRNYIKSINSFVTNYYIPNIKNTFINSKLHYQSDRSGNFSRGIAVDRPFYSPLAKWAAGIELNSFSNIDTLKYITSVFVPLKLKFNSQDFWGGKAFQVFKGNSEDELTTNLILAGRYLRVRYTEKPSAFYDPLNIYGNEDFYLTSVAISMRKFVQDKFVFKYGVVEDVPVGKVFGVTAGYQLKNNSGRPYLGIRVSNGNYNTWGYLSLSLEYGTFFKAFHPEQGVIAASVNYFTGLFEVGNWKFRQFVKTQVTLGIQRFAYDSLTLNDGYGLDGFNSLTLTGTKRLLFSLQTQTYSPWRLLGFRFGPYLAYSMGILGDSKRPFSRSRVYSQIGLGVLIKNENLVFDTFQISISFYPNIPGLGQNLFKMNSYRTTDFGIRDFESGKPTPVMYR